MINFHEYEKKVESFYLSFHITGMGISRAYRHCESTESINFTSSTSELRVDVNKKYKLESKVREFLKFSLPFPAFSLFLKTFFHAHFFLCFFGIEPEGVSLC